MKPRVFLALLVVAALVAGCTTKASGYPEKYMLAADELPEGLKLSEIPPEMEQFGFRENPAEIPAQFMQSLGEGFAEFKPERVWVELVEKTTSSSQYGADGGLMLAAGFWADEGKAKAVTDQMKAEGDQACEDLGEVGVVMRDRNVVVMISGDESMQAFVPQVESALKEKAPGLESIC